MCHSFLPSLGRLVPGPEKVVETLLEKLGPSGTLVVPTFSHSYFNEELYDVEHSPSVVGLLSELVRKHPAAVRSLDPNFSMAAIGSAAGLLMDREVAHSFGKGSIYDKLMQADVHILLVGTDFTALSLFMHLEKLHGVPYRHDKEFRGRTRYKGSTFSDSAVHFVRDRNLKPITHRQRVGALIDHDPQCVRRLCAYGEHRFVPARVVARIVAEELTKDPFVLIKEPVQ